MFDCHCHLYPPQFTAKEVAHLSAEAAAAGVEAVVTVPEDLRDCAAVLALARANPLIAPCAGLHPVQPIHAEGAPYSGARCVAAADLPPVLEFIRAHASEIVAIGEVGLDFSPHVLNGDAALKDVQRAVFAAQIAAARELGLPLNVHSRSAGHHAIDMLLEGGLQSGALLHAFDGRAVHALRAVQASPHIYFSVPPSAARSPQQQKLVAALPLERLVLETDAPALAPERGARNRPANLTVARDEVARIKGLPAAEVARATRANALRLFPRLARWAGGGGGGGEGAAAAVEVAPP
ncbi:MAG: TatD DNase domain-containing 3 [Monoraphidium minutum]|nr:MAG: TatD DNase domain-containing 3 [Monoraphidium minutum]